MHHSVFDVVLLLCKRNNAQIKQFINYIMVGYKVTALDSMLFGIKIKLFFIRTVWFCLVCCLEHLTSSVRFSVFSA